jgi:hypothetical protein
MKRTGGLRVAPLTLDAARFDLSRKGRGIFPYFIASSARFSFSTFTCGSPMMPNNRPVM